MGKERGCCDCLCHNLIEGRITRAHTDPFHYIEVLTYLSQIYISYDICIFSYVHQGNIFECSEDIWDKSFDLNVKSMYLMCHALLPKMVTKGSGVIINMSSICSSLKGAERRFAYGTTKGAVIGFTKARGRGP